MFNTSGTQEDCDVCGSFEDDNPRMAIELKKIDRKGGRTVRLVICSDCKYELDAQLSRIDAE